MELHRHFFLLGIDYPRTEKREKNQELQIFKKCKNLRLSWFWAWFGFGLISGSLLSSGSVFGIGITLGLSLKDRLGLLLNQGFIFERLLKSSIQYLILLILKGCHHLWGSFIFWCLVTSLMCSANLQSTNTSHSWIDIVYTKHKRKGWFKGDSAVKSLCWHRVSCLWLSDPDLLRFVAAPQFYHFLGRTRSRLVFETGNRNCSMSLTSRRKISTGFSGWSVRSGSKRRRLTRGSWKLLRSPF